MGRRKYRYWTDQQISDFLESLGRPLSSFVTTSAFYGWYDESGRLFISLDDDDERAELVIKFLKRIGARDVASEEQSDGES